MDDSLVAWNGNRKNMRLWFPIVVVVLSILVYLSFFYIDPGSEGIIFFRVLVLVLAMMFILPGIYTLFRDAWWAVLPFNYELFNAISGRIEQSLSDKGIIFCQPDSDILAIVPGRQGKTLVIQTEGPELKVMIEIMDRRDQKKRVSNSKIMISNICKANLSTANDVKDALTELLQRLKYKDYY